MWYCCVLSPLLVAGSGRARIGCMVQGATSAVLPLLPSSALLVNTGAVSVLDPHDCILTVTVGAPDTHICNLVL